MIPDASQNLWIFLDALVLRFCEIFTICCCLQGPPWHSIQFVWLHHEGFFGQARRFGKILREGFFGIQGECLRGCSVHLIKIKIKSLNIIGRATDVATCLTDFIFPSREILNWRRCSERDITISFKNVCIEVSISHIYRFQGQVRRGLPIRWHVWKAAALHFTNVGTKRSTKKNITQKSKSKILIRILNLTMIVQVQIFRNLLS